MHWCCTLHTDINYKILIPSDMFKNKCAAANNNSAVYQSITNQQDMWGHAHLRTCRFPAAIVVSCQNSAHSTYHRLESKHLPSDSNSALSSEIALGRLCPKSAATTANSYNFATCYNTAEKQTEHYICLTSYLTNSRYPCISNYILFQRQWSMEIKRIQRINQSSSVHSHQSVNSHKRLHVPMHVLTGGKELA